MDKKRGQRPLQSWGIAMKNHHVTPVILHFVLITYGSIFISRFQAIVFSPEWREKLEESIRAHEDGSKILDPKTLRRYHALIRKSNQREELFKSGLKTQNNTTPIERIRARRSRGSLLQQFRENRAHLASHDSTDTVGNGHSPSGTEARDKNGGEYVSAGKSVEPAEETTHVFRTSRLSEGEVESRAKEMLKKLESVQRGELELAPKTVGRYKKFVARYRDLEIELGLIDEGDLGFKVTAATGSLDGSKKGNKVKYEEQFESNREMFLAKSLEAREKVAEKLTNE